MEIKSILNLVLTTTPMLNNTAFVTEQTSIKYYSDNASVTLAQSLYADTWDIDTIVDGWNTCPIHFNFNMKKIFLNGIKTSIPLSLLCNNFAQFEKYDTVEACGSFDNTGAIDPIYEARERVQNWNEIALNNLYVSTSTINTTALDSDIKLSANTKLIWDAKKSYKDINAKIHYNTVLNSGKDINLAFGINRNFDSGEVSVKGIPEVYFKEKLKTGFLWIMEIWRFLWTLNMEDTNQNIKGNYINLADFVKIRNVDYTNKSFELVLENDIAKFNDMFEKCNFTFSYDTYVNGKMTTVNKNLFFNEQNSYKNKMYIDGDDMGNLFFRMNYLKMNEYIDAENFVQENKITSLKNIKNYFNDNNIMTNTDTKKISFLSGKNIIDGKKFIDDVDVVKNIDKFVNKNDKIWNIIDFKTTDFQIIKNYLNGSVTIKYVPNNQEWTFYGWKKPIIDKKVINVTPNDINHLHNYEDLKKLLLQNESIDEYVANNADLSLKNKIIHVKLGNSIDEDIQLKVVNLSANAINWIMISVISLAIITLGIGGFFWL